MTAHFVPIVLFFFLGLVLKRSSFVDSGSGEFLLKLVFFVTLPALVLTKIPPIELTADKALLPFLNVAVNAGCMLAAWLVCRRIRPDRRSSGSVMVGTMIPNNAFMFPFILAGLGDAAFADAVLFDFGNAVMVATVTYTVAFQYGGLRSTPRAMLTRLAKSPLVWALLVAVSLSIYAIDVPRVLTGFLEPVGAMTSPLLLMALGMLFSARFSQWKLVAWIIVLRMLLGLLLGMGLAFLCGLDGTSFVVVSLCASAPVGFNALTFSVLAGLNKELTASAVSLSIVVGMVYVPLLLMVLRFWIHAA